MYKYIYYSVTNNQILIHCVKVEKNLMMTPLKKKNGIHSFMVYMNIVIISGYFQHIT